GKRVIVRKPLFPSYLFVETELTPNGFQQALLQYRSQIRGILKELKYEDDVSALSSEERAYLEGLMDEEHNVRLSKGEILDGEVIITEGPLKGYESNII
ncbi:transcription antiterminator, partial [Erysipelatoclostridium ramosum]|nr:transcription antiterminator [Thomasclavelia ramosa]